MKYRLATGLHPVLRAGDSVQFGLDSARSGIMRTTSAPAVVATVATFTRPLGREEIVHRLATAAGLATAAADSVASDLIAARVLVPVGDGIAVALLGRGALYNSVRTLLEASGLSVRTPLSGETEKEFLEDQTKLRPVVVVDRLAHSLATARLLHNYSTTWLTAAVVDYRGIIGPVYLGGRGPCPVCFDLHATDEDARWHRVAIQLPLGPPAPDPLAVAATAQQVTSTVLAMVGHPPPAGMSYPPVRPGQTWVVSPHDPTGAGLKVLLPHRRCPLCHDAGKLG